MWELLQAAIGAGAAAVCLNLTFWLKSKEPFDFGKFATSILLAFGVGIIGTILGVEISIIEASPLYAAIAIVLENLIKATSRRD